MPVAAPEAGVGERHMYGVDALWNIATTVPAPKVAESAIALLITLYRSAGSEIIAAELTTCQ